MAYSGVAYVQQEIGFDYGFLIPLISMIAALIIFMVAKHKYKHTPAGGKGVHIYPVECRDIAQEFCLFTRNYTEVLDRII